MACDTCGKNDKSLEAVKEEYQTDDIKQVCYECRKEINDHIWKIRRLNSGIEKSFTKKFMECLRSKVTNLAHHTG